jgi:hypothetical protein
MSGKVLWQYWHRSSGLLGNIGKTGFRTKMLSVYRAPPDMQDGHKKRCRLASSRSAFKRGSARSFAFGTMAVKATEYGPTGAGTRKSDRREIGDTWFRTHLTSRAPINGNSDFASVDCADRELTHANIVANRCGPCQESPRAFEAEFGLR